MTRSVRVRTGDGQPRIEPFTLPPTVEQPLLLHGDCLDILPRLPADSIDAVVTDPPAGIAFMGRDWDNLTGYAPRTDRGREVAERLAGLLEPWAVGFVTFMTDVFTETFRVVKPGAHLLAWALPRTSDLTMLALRFAGWEVRDSLAHLFGTGFAKSHDVSKAIDKLHGAERAVVGPNPNHRNPDTDHHERWNSAVLNPSITAPATDEAKRHAGFGTALSPGYEQWILARRPLMGTVAANVLEFGTGGINVDACRIQATASDAAEMAGRSGASPRTSQGTFSDGLGISEMWTPNVLGRWPKNIMLSCAIECSRDAHTPWCPVAELDRQSGTLTSGTGAVRRETAAGHQGHVFGATSQPEGTPQICHGDSGGASRFFPRFAYHPKASDRRVPGREDIENRHPTVKNTDLIRWLIRLITPPGGIVLDAFSGSGTTGVAAVHEGVRVACIERDAASYEVGRGRIMAAIGSPEYAAEAAKLAPAGAQLTLL